MLDTVTFDLWNTLMANSPPDMERYRLRRVEKLGELLQEHRQKIEPDRLLEAYRKGFDKCKETWERNLDLSTEEQLELIFKLLGDGKLQRRALDLMPHLVEAYISPILEDPPQVIDGARDVLRDIKSRGYKIGLICNTGTSPGRVIRVLLERFGMIQYFDNTTFSNELRIRKPDPRIFLHTLKELGSQPGGSAHVGDLLDADIWGAKNVGMVSVHFHPDQTPCDDLEPDFSIKHLSELKLILGDLKQTQNG